MEITLEAIDGMLDSLAEDCKLTIGIEREYLKINVRMIDVDMETHAEHYYNVSTLYARASFLTKKIKQYEKEQRGKKSLAIRKNPKKYGFEKVSEGAIDDLLSSDVTLLAIQDNVYEVEKLLDITEGLVTAYEHRRSMMNDITKLMGKNIMDGGEAMGVKEYTTAIRHSNNTGHNY